MAVEMIRIQPDMTPAEAWDSFVQVTGITPTDSALTVFMAGFSAGMAYLDGRLTKASQHATCEIAQLVEAGPPDEERAHRA